jgi:hypothetical protein
VDVAFGLLMFNDAFVHNELKLLNMVVDVAFKFEIGIVELVDRLFKFNVVLDDRSFKFNVVLDDRSFKFNVVLDDKSFKSVNIVFDVV